MLIDVILKSLLIYITKLFFTGFERTHLLLLRLQHFDVQTNALCIKGVPPFQFHSFVVT